MEVTQPKDQKRKILTAVLILCACLLVVIIVKSNESTSKANPRPVETANNPTGIKYVPNVTEIPTLSSMPDVFHAQVSEFDSKSKRVSADDQVCRLTGSTFNLKRISNLSLPSPSVSSPFYLEDRIFMVTNKPQLICLELNDTSPNKVGELDLTQKETNLPYALISSGEEPNTLALFVHDWTILVVNITEPNKMSLLPDQEYQLPEQDVKIEDFAIYKKHIILAKGKSGISVYKIENVNAKHRALENNSSATSSTSTTTSPTTSSSSTAASLTTANTTNPTKSVTSTSATSTSVTSTALQAKAQPKPQPQLQRVLLLQQQQVLPLLRQQQILQ